MSVGYELDLENDVRKDAKELGWVSIKLGLKGSTGWPDIIFLREGAKIVWIEFKEPGKRPKKKQARKLALLTALGFTALWCDDYHKAMETLNNAVDT
jgi:hypothetical protein